MKREIKFRARYDDMGGGWRYGMLIYEGDVPRVQEKGTMYFSTCLKGTEGQYTGLKDKNGKEIYEGDLISHISRNGRKPHPVVYKSGAFCGEYGLVYPLFNEHFDKYCEIEVIGNIHENPELINIESQDDI